MFITGRDLWTIHGVILLEIKLIQGAIVYEKNK